jgi:hypothetical protein
MLIESFLVKSIAFPKKIKWQTLFINAWCECSAHWWHVFEVDNPRA